VLSVQTLIAGRDTGRLVVEDGVFRDGCYTVAHPNRAQSAAASRSTTRQASFGSGRLRWLWKFPAFDV
jgi:hypothetical protein